MLDENTLRRIEFLPSFVDPCNDQTSRGAVASRSLNLPSQLYCTLIVDVYLYHEVQIAMIRKQRLKVSFHNGLLECLANVFIPA